MNARSRLGYLARSWGALTALQRADWNGFAAGIKVPDGFGGLIGLNGFQVFCQQNMLAMSAGTISVYTAVPNVNRIGSVIQNFVGVPGSMSGQVGLSWTHAVGLATAERHEYQIAGPFGSAARKAQDNDWGIKHNLVNTALSVTITDLLPGGHYWFRIRIVRSFGDKTSWLITQSDAAV